MNNKIKKYVKSEPIPKSNKGNVKIIVGKTFIKHVLKSENDVLMNFYSPF